MRSLLFWEFTKLTRNKRFVGFLTAALIFNLFVLLGGLFFGSLPSDSSVRAAARDLDGLCLTDQQKRFMISPSGLMHWLSCQVMGILGCTAVSSTLKVNLQNT